LPRVVEERPVAVVAAGEQAQQLGAAVIELVVAEGADQVAALLGEGLHATRHLHLPAEIAAMRVGQQIEKADRGLVL